MAFILTTTDSMARALKVDAADVEIPSAMGTALHVRLFAPQTPARAVVVVQGALGTPQRHYAALATFLAEHGISVVTCDYRDGAGSRAAAKQSQVRALDWATQDQPAVLSWARRQADGRPLVILAHSMGGHFIGMSKESVDVDGIVFVATQSTWFGHWPGLRRLQMWALWTLLVPGATTALGYLPGTVYGGTNLPASCVVDGVRWARHPLSHGQDEGVRDTRARLVCPLRAYSFSDDHFHAPRPAVDAFLATLPNQRLDHRHLVPSDVGLNAIGHTGFFSRRCTDLWRELLDFGPFQELAK